MEKEDKEEMKEMECPKKLKEKGKQAKWNRTKKRNRRMKQGIYKKRTQNSRFLLLVFFCKYGIKI